MASTYISLPAASSSTITGPIDVNISSSNDSIRISDGTDTLAVNGDGSINASDILTVGGVFGNLVVGTSSVAVRVGASNYSGRKFLTIQNLSTNDIYWGFDSTVTVSSGLSIPRNTERTFSVADSVTIWVIADAPNLNCRVAEAK